MRVSEIHDLERSAADREIQELTSGWRLAETEVKRLQTQLRVAEIEKATTVVRLSTEQTLNTMLVKAIDEALKAEEFSIRVDPEIMAPLKKAKNALTEFRSLMKKE